MVGAAAIFKAAKRKTKMSAKQDWTKFPQN
jgi:hypothetical protein